MQRIPRYEEGRVVRIRLAFVGFPNLDGSVPISYLDWAKSGLTSLCHCLELDDDIASFAG